MKYKVTDNRIILGSYPGRKIIDETLIEKLLKLDRKDDIASYEGERYFIRDNNAYLFEDIVWRVIYIKDSLAYVVSELILDSKAFDEEDYCSNIFTESSLRKWLNSEFKKMAGLSNVESLGKFVNDDLLSLLSKEDIEDYSSIKEAEISDFAIKSTDYWTRTDSPYFGRVFTDTSWEFANQVMGVRPVMFVPVDVETKYGPSFLKTASINPLIIDENEAYFGVYPKTMVMDEKVIEKLDEIPADENGYLLLNNYWYYRLVDKADGNKKYFLVEPITWQILLEDDKEIVLYSKYLIDARPYIHLYYRSEKDLKEWLNNDFMHLAFLDKINCLAEEDNRGKVFLLNIKELGASLDYYEKAYFDIYDREARMATMSDFAKEKGDGYSTLYWTDSRPSDDEEVEDEDEGFLDDDEIESRRTRDINVYLIDAETGESLTSYEYELNHVRPAIIIKK